MAYSAITNAEIDQDSPITQTLMTKYRDNIILAAEGLWHPYDRTEPDGSADGVFYDHAVDGDVASVETPDFAAGYDYLIIMDGLSHNLGVSTAIRIELYKDTDAAYGSSRAITPSDADGNTFYAEVFLRNPKGWARPDLWGTAAGSTDSTSAAQFFVDANDATVQTCGKARIDMSGDIDAGKIMLLRRKILWGL